MDWIGYSETKGRLRSKTSLTQDYLTIKISREDQGVQSSFTSAVSKVEQSLHVSGALRGQKP